MKNIMKQNRKKSISKKILLILVAMVLITTIIIDSVSIYENRKEVILLKSEQAESIAKMVAVHIDGDQFAALVKAKKETEYYTEIKQILANLKDVSGVKYLYAVVPQPENQQIQYIAEGTSTRG